MQGQDKVQLQQMLCIVIDQQEMLDIVMGLIDQNMMNNIDINREYKKGNRRWVGKSYCLSEEECKELHNHYEWIVPNSIINYHNLLDHIRR